MAHTLPSSSISLESHKRCHPQPISSTGRIAPPSPPYKKQKQPSSPPIEAMIKPFEYLEPWPLPHICRETFASAIVSCLTWAGYGMMTRQKAKAIAEEIEDETYKAVDAAADISPGERYSMYSDLMFSQLDKYALSGSEFTAKVESDPRYAVFRPDFIHFGSEEGLTSDRSWLCPQQQQDSGITSHESLEAFQAISSEQAQLQTPHAQWATTSSQQQQDSGMSSHESLDAVQVILSDKDKLGQVLVQHPKLLEMLQEKLEQQQ